MHKVVLISKGKRIEQPKAEKPVENTEWMLSWCRSHIPGFADCQDRALASKNGVLPIGAKK